MFHVPCSCGVNLKVNESLVGKRVKCPACAGVVVVPAPQVLREAPSQPAGSGYRPAPGRSAAHEEPPPPRPRSRPVYDDEAEDRPRRRKQPAKSGSGMLLWVGLGCGALLLLVVVAGAGVGAYFLFIKGKPGDSKSTATATGTGSGTSTGAGKGGPGPKTEGVVKFWLPKKVGDVREIEFTNDMFDRFDDVVGGKKTLNSGTTNQFFKGKIKTLQADNQGRETLVEVTVDTCRDTFNGIQNNLLTPGTAIEAEARFGSIEVRFKNGGMMYTDNIGLPFMRKVVNMQALNSDTDDIARIFGTNERKKEGDIWTGDRDILLSIVNKPRLDKLPREAVAGKATVVKVLKEGGVNYVDLEATITQTFKNFTEMRFNNQPANFNVNGDIVTVWTFRFPADYSTGPVKSGWKSTTNQRHQGTLNGQNATMVTEIRDSWSETAKYSSSGKN